MKEQPKTDAAWLVVKLATDSLTATELRALADRVEAEGATSNYVPLQQAMAEGATTLREWANAV